MEIKPLILEFDSKEAALIFSAIASSGKQPTTAILEACELLKKKYSRRKR